MKSLHQGNTFENATCRKSAMLGRPWCGWLTWQHTIQYLAPHHQDHWYLWMSLNKASYKTIRSPVKYRNIESCWARVHIISPLQNDIIQWRHFLHYWPFVRGIYQSPVNSPHKGQWHGALKFSLICTWINGWVNNHEADDLRCHLAHYAVIVMAAANYVMWKDHGRTDLFQNEEKQQSANRELSYFDVLYLYIDIHNSLAPVKCGTQAMVFKLIINNCSLDTHSKIVLR